MARAAPLVSIAEAPAPPGGEAEWFQGAGGVRLRAALWPATAAVRGSVVLSPGRTEPIEKYFEVVTELRARGFCVIAHDWRGQGLSQRLLPDRLKGHADSPADFAADHRALLDAFADRLPQPWIALAHSMGGALVMLALAEGEGRLAAALLTAPMLGVATGAAPGWAASGIARLMRLTGRAAAYALPASDPLSGWTEGNPLTHDRARYERYKAQLRACPELGLGSPTWGWLLMGLQLGSRLAAPGALEAITLPVSLVTAGEERLVLNAAARAAARRLPDGRCLEIPGARHELFMETDPIRAKVWQAFDALADPISPPRA